MRFGLIAVVVAACGGTTSQPAHAPAASEPEGACGSATCAEPELCIETSVGPGTPQVAHPETSLTYRCAIEPETRSGYSCTAVEHRRQHCVALVPAAPPR